MKRFSPLLLAGFFLAPLTGAARAELIVLGSDTDKVAIGTVLPDGAVLEVPEGASVRVMSRSGHMQTIQGPAAKPVGEFSGTGPADTALWDSVRSRLARPQPVSARELSEKAVARTRGLESKPAPAPASYTFSWVKVPLFAEGDVCVEKGAKLSLERQGSAKAERVVVVELPAGRRSEANFAQGTSVAPWPADLEPRVGSYALQVPDTGVRQVKLRLISPLPTQDDVLRVLHGQRCELQRNALIDALKDPKFQISALGR